MDHMQVKGISLIWGMDYVQVKGVILTWDMVEVQTGGINFNLALCSADISCAKWHVLVLYCSVP